MLQLIFVFDIKFKAIYYNKQIQYLNPNMKRGGIIFNSNPCADNALMIIVKEVSRILTETSQIKLSQIQIQVKFAQFKYFCQPSYETLNHLPQKIRQTCTPAILNLVEQQRYNFKESLKKLSFQNMIHLNQLGRRVYMLHSGFDDRRYKKFYFIKEFLIRICQFNKLMKEKNIFLRQHPKNIYHQFSQFADNSSFQLVQEDQLRLDLYVNGQGPIELQGRYTYSPKIGWCKTKKTPMLKQQIDIMLSQKTFRIAANQQEQTAVAYQDLCSIKQLFKKPRSLQIRLKKALRVTKGNKIEYSLSQVYEAKSIIENFSDLQDIILEDKIILDDYLISKFQIFYLTEYSKDAKFQIEAEFTKNGIYQLKNYARDNLKMIHYEIQDAIYSLYNLIWSDHSVKLKQAAWMDKLLNYFSNSNEAVSYPKTRLANQFGTYMHNILYEEMTELKNRNVI